MVWIHMFDIYLTDTQQHIKFADYPGEHPVKFVLSFKKIFPSTMELILPVLPNDENLEEMTWESNTRDLEIFKQLIQAWGIVELRLAAISQYKDRDFADQLVRQAQNYRQKLGKTKTALSTLDLDYLLLHEIHAQIDAQLIDLGEKFYLPILRNLWKDVVSTQVLEAKF